MRIQVTEVGGVEVKTNKNGKNYRSFELKFVSEGKAGKKMLFATSGVGETLVEAKVGSLWDIREQQDGKYTNWVGIESAGQAAPEQVKEATKAKSTYETPEERARKQLLIVKQWSVSTAVTALGTDKDTEQYFTLAKQFEAYVYGDATDDSEKEVD